MFRTLFKDSSTYAIAGAISQGIAFVLFPFFAHVFRPRDYGALDILMLLGMLTNLTVALEISQGLGRQLADTEDERERAAYTSTALLFTVACWSILGVVVFAFAAPLSRVVLGTGFGPGLLRLAAAIWCLNGILYLTQDQLRWRLRPRSFATVSIAVAATTTATSAVLVLGVGAGISGALVGQLAGVSCGLVVTACLSRGIYSWRFDWAKCRGMLAYSIPLIAGSVGVFMNGFADRLVLQHRGSLAEVGIYGIAYRFSAIMALVMVGFQGAMMPLVLSRHRDPRTPGELARVFRLFCALALAALLVTSVLADQVVRLVAAPAYASAATIVPLVIAASLLGSMTIFAPGPIIARSTMSITVVWGSAGLLNVALAFVLVHPLGIDGAAIAAVVSSAWAFGGMMILSQRRYEVPHDWARIARAAAAVVILITLGAVAIPSGHAVALRPEIVLLRLMLAAAGTVTIWRVLVDPGERTDAWRACARQVRILGWTRLGSSEGA